MKKRKRKEEKEAHMKQHGQHIIDDVEEGGTKMTFKLSQQLRVPFIKNYLLKKGTMYGAPAQ